jgi:uncharacterized membrane protein
MNLIFIFCAILAIVAAFKLKSIPAKVAFVIIAGYAILFAFGINVIMGPYHRLNIIPLVIITFSFKAAMSDD